jgi:hypothetical protein
MKNEYTTEEKEMVRKLKEEILNEFKYEKIRFGSTKEIFVNGTWLEIELFYFRESYTKEFTKMVIKKWKMEKCINDLTKRDEELAEKLKMLIYFDLTKEINSRLYKEIEMKVEAIYIKNGLFKLYFNNNEFELSKVTEENAIWFKDLFKNMDTEETDEITGLLIKRKIEADVSVWVIKELLTRYLVEIYSQTEEYKLRNLYK